MSLESFNSKNLFKKKKKRLHKSKVWKKGKAETN